jgi:muramidase (phage lysozyme)
MQIKQLDSFYFVNKIKEHSKIKDKLLKQIAKMKDDNLATVSKTDFAISTNSERPYLKLFNDTMDRYIKKIMATLQFKTCVIHNVWYQQYKNKSSHGWHTHPKVNYTNVYYLELPDKSKKTKIYNVITKKFEELDVEEGDLVTFPAHIPHGSPVIDDTKRKTVIVFNCCFTDLDINI